jgi:hypothetical protein
MVWSWSTSSCSCIRSTRSMSKHTKLGALFWLTFSTGSLYDHQVSTRFFITSINIYITSSIACSSRLFCSIVIHL